VNQFPHVNLISQHWYQYTLSTAFFPSASQVYIKAEVFDLGLSGTATPVLVSFADHTISDNILSADTAIQVSISGATYGGGIYLDNFHFHGRKGFSNCVVSTGIAESENSQKIMVYPTLAENNLNIICNDRSKGIRKINLFNMEGEKLLSSETSLIKTNLNISAVPCGIYIVSCQTLNEAANFKIVINR
jgi:hypothetical protein